MAKNAGLGPLAPAEHANQQPRIAIGILYLRGASLWKQRHRWMLHRASHQLGALGFTQLTSTERVGHAVCVNLLAGLLLQAARVMRISLLHTTLRQAYRGGQPAAGGAAQRTCLRRGRNGGDPLLRSHGVDGGRARTQRQGRRGMGVGTYARGNRPAAFGIRDV